MAEDHEGGSTAQIRAEFDIVSSQEIRDAEDDRQKNEVLAQQLSELGDDDEEEGENELYDPNDLHASDDYVQVLPEEEEGEAEDLEADSDEVEIQVPQEDEPVEEEVHESDEEMEEVPVQVKSPDNKSPGRRSTRRNNSL